MDDLTLVVGGQRLAGWTDVRVTRGCERCPSDFALELTERYPDAPAETNVQDGDACEVLLGADRVITGYVDRYTPSIDARMHKIAATGRGKCQDLVDCSAEWPGGQIVGADALAVAKKLAKPYGISVSSEVKNLKAIPQHNLTIGETAWEVIERVCRYSALLAYELADGSLRLAQVGKKRHASGIVQGQNVQAASFVRSADQRFSTYRSFLNSVDTLGDAGEGGNLLATFADPTVKRHRQLDLITEAPSGGREWAVKRIKWEAARRFGRARAVTVTVDSWRDAAGQLWEPNWLVPVALPLLKLERVDWVISSVTYRRGMQGTAADLVIMPPQAFQPEPLLNLVEAPLLDVPAGVAR